MSEPNATQIAAAVDAVSRTMYDLAQNGVSVLDVNVGLVANGVMRLSLHDVVSIALRAVGGDEPSRDPKNIAANTWDERERVIYDAGVLAGMSDAEVQLNGGIAHPNMAEQQGWGQ